MKIWFTPSEKSRTWLSVLAASTAGLMEQRGGPGFGMERSEMIEAAVDANMNRRRKSLWDGEERDGQGCSDANMNIVNIEVEVLGGAARASTRRLQQLLRVRRREFCRTAKGARVGATKVRVAISCVNRRRRAPSAAAAHPAYQAMKTVCNPPSVRAYVQQPHRKLAASNVQQPSDASHG